MEYIDVLSKLCYYDKRNPDNCSYIALDGRAVNCYCDNCFYGRTDMAEHILKTDEALKAIIESYESMHHDNHPESGSTIGISSLQNAKKQILI